MTDKSTPTAPAPRQSPTFSTPQMARLQQEIDATRTELAATVDELTARLDPRAQGARLVADGRQLVADATDSNAEPTARRHAWIVLGIAAGVTVVVVAGLVRKIVR